MRVGADGGFARDGLFLQLLGEALRPIARSGPGHRRIGGAGDRAGD